MRVRYHGLKVVGALSTAYDIRKDGVISAGDVFQRVNTALQMAFLVYGVLYGAIDLGSSLIFDKNLI